MSGDSILRGPRLGNGAKGCCSFSLAARAEAGMAIIPLVLALVFAEPGCAWKNERIQGVACIRMRVSAVASLLHSSTGNMDIEIERLGCDDAWRYAGKRKCSAVNWQIWQMSSYFHGIKCFSHKNDYKQTNWVIVSLVCKQIDAGEPIGNDWK